MTTLASVELARERGHDPATALGRFRKCVEVCSGPDPHDRVVANAIARRKVAGGRKRSCGPRQPDARDWANPIVRRGVDRLDPGERLVANSIVSSATSRRAKQSSGAASTGGWLWAIARATNYSARPRSGRPLFREALVREGCWGPWCRSQCRRGGVRRMLPREGMRPLEMAPALPFVAKHKSALPRANRLGCGSNGVRSECPDSLMIRESGRRHGPIFGRVRAHWRPLEKATARSDAAGPPECPRFLSMKRRPARVMTS